MKKRMKQNRARKRGTQIQAYEKKDTPDNQISDSASERRSSFREVSVCIFYGSA